MNASLFAVNSSVCFKVNFLANNYYALSSLTLMDEKFGLAGILFLAVLILYKLVRQMISCRHFSHRGFARSDASMSEFVPELPDDIMMEILVRLPVSSIFLFRSVSRSFRSLVLECHACNRLPPVLLGILCVGLHPKRARYVSLLKGFGDSSMDHDPTQFLTKSSLDYEMFDCKFGIILCRGSRASNVIYLCNPATKKCRSIPYDGSYYHFILAFDPSWSEHHHEIIKISKNHMVGGYIFEVFSSKTGRWDRKFTITEYYIEFRLESSCFVSGLLHIFERCYSDLIAINCADGSYKRVGLPSYDWSRDVGGLCNSCGSLMYSKLYRGELSVWTLLKNENESCWLLRHRIYLKDKLQKIGFSFPFDIQHDGCYGCILLFHLNTVVMRINWKIFLYDLESDDLQVATSIVFGSYLLPWSHCYYAVAGL